MNGNLKLLSPDRLVVGCRVRYDPSVHPPALAVLESPIGKGSYTDADLWWCLIKFRVAIEPAGWRVLCQGARQNVWPSGMSAQFTNGVGAYLLDPLRRRSGSGYEHVNVFDGAPTESAVTIWEQAAWCGQFFGQDDKLIRIIRAAVAKWSSPA